MEAKKEEEIELLLLKMSNCSNEVREMATRICSNYLSGIWKNISSRDIMIKHIGGGLSNLLYHVSLPKPQKPKSREPSQVILRLYGQNHGEQAMESLVTESVVFTLLSEQGLGPKLHGVFPRGRLEEFIPVSFISGVEHEYIIMRVKELIKLVQFTNKVDLQAWKLIQRP
uniref:Choline kinase n=1 Tax=Timema monikensis TaxID=170555 RepID=A0A7R9E0E1_9NEOP|nr:unnamed protein product [Timema monikensis]